MTKTVFIVNPASGNGRTGRVWNELEPAAKWIFPESETIFSNYEGHCSELAASFAKDGVDRIVSVGGDGTHHEIVSGLFEGKFPIQPEIGFTIIPMGTGNDLARTLGISRNPRQALDELPSLTTSVCDVGYVELFDAGGKPAEKYFINAMNLGLGAKTVELVNQTSKALGGKVSFLVGALRSMFVYKSNSISLFDKEGTELFNGAFLNIAVSNGKFCGGGMKMAPDARPDDGQFDLVIMKSMNLPSILVNMPKIYSGTHISHPKAVYRNLDYLEARPAGNGDVFAEVDGNSAGKLPLKVHCLAGALKVLGK